MSGVSLSIGRIKIVPEDRPNDDGKWIDLPEPIDSAVTWLDIANLLAPFIPDGWILVATERFPEQ